MLNKLKLLVSNDHPDHSGGGNYFMMILSLLKDYVEFYVDDHLDYYSDPSTLHAFSKEEIHPVDSSFVPDLHLYASYRGWMKPRSSNAIQVCYYPIKKKIDGWNTMNAWVARQISLQWKKSTFVVSPFYENSNFHVTNKENTCITIGNYFYGKNKHSKNQHLIIEWFEKNKQVLNLKELILHGFILDQSYYDKLHLLAKSNVNIRIHNASPKEQILQDLAKSKYLIHAMGLGRNTSFTRLLNPLGLYRARIPEVEHFGLIAVEALLSGCLPIVHNSGGCPEIEGTMIYENLCEINQIIKSNPQPNVDSLVFYGKKYCRETSALQV